MQEAQPVPAIPVSTTRLGGPFTEIDGDRSTGQVVRDVPDVPEAPLRLDEWHLVNTAVGHRTRDEILYKLFLEVDLVTKGSLKPRSGGRVDEGFVTI